MNNENIEPMVARASGLALLAALSGPIAVAGACTSPQFLGPQDAAPSIIAPGEGDPSMDRDAALEAPVKPDAGDEHDAETAPSLGTDAGPKTDAGDELEGAFIDDFDRPDAPLDSPPWYVEAPSKMPRIQDGRVCLAAGEELVLLLPKAQYGYVQVDVPGGSGPVLRALQGDNAEVFDLSWGERTIRDYSGEHKPLSPRAFRVDRFEAELDPSTKEAKLSLAGQDAVTRAFVQLTPDDEKLRLYAVPEAVGAGHFQLRISNSNHAALTCIDNLYVGPERPRNDPFAKSDAVEACRPPADPDVACLTQCCSQLAALDAAQPSCDRGESSAVCGYGIVSCTQDCLLSHPSHNVKYCDARCRVEMAATKTDLDDYFQCVHDACPREPEVLEPNLVPLSWPTDGPASSERLMVSLPEMPDDGSDSIPDLVSVSPTLIDPLTGEQSSMRSFHVSPYDVLQVFTNPSHSRVIAVVGGWRGAGTRPFEMPTRLYTWHPGYMRQLRFPTPIITVFPSPSRRYLWVRTYGTSYLVSYDGRILFEAPVPQAIVKWGPDEAYTLVGRQNYLARIDFAQGKSSNVVTPGGMTADMIVGTFRDSLAWSFEQSNGESDPPKTSQWFWTDLDGMALPSPPLSGVELERSAAGFPTSHHEGEVYWMGEDGLLPAARRGADAPVLSANSTYVLYGSLLHGSLAVTRTDGVLVASQDFSTKGISEIAPCDPTRGLISSSSGYELLAFELQGTSIATKVLSTTSLGSSGTFRGHPESCTFVIDVPGQKPRLVDVANGSDIELDIDPAGRHVWAEYPPRQMYQP